MLGLDELVARPAVVSVRLQDEEDVVLRCDLGEKDDVLPGDQGELLHVAGVQLRVRGADGLDEAAELRAEDFQGDVAAAESLDGDAVQPDQARGHRPFDPVPQPGQYIPKHYPPLFARPWPASSRA